MSELMQPVAQWCAALVEALGIGLIVAGTVYSLVFGGWQWLKSAETDRLFHDTRQRLGRSILLGLEFLVAADIIHTVAVELNLTNVGVLAAIVLIRTFLSFVLEVELTGSWPWQKKGPGTQ